MTNQLKTRAVNFYWKMLSVVFAFLFSLPAFSQDEKKIDVDIDTSPDDASGMFSQPWVWIVGAAIFILLLVALLRNNKK